MYSYICKISLGGKISVLLEQSGGSTHGRQFWQVLLCIITVLDRYCELLSKRFRSLYLV